MTTTQWVKPAPLWPFTDINYQQPWLAESKSDRFIPDFLDLMAGNVPAQTPADLRQWQPAPTTGEIKLYQPMHGRYYLVTGSLVCAQLGLPDHTVARQSG